MAYFLNHVMAHSIYFITDPCQIKNGGCHANATCHVDGNQVMAMIASPTANWTMVDVISLQVAMLMQR